MTGNWRHESFVASLTNKQTATVRAYRLDVETLMAWAWQIGINGPDEIGRPESRRYLAHLSDRGYATATVARRVAGLRAYWRWALRRGLVTENPWQRVSIRRRVRVPHVLEDQEVAEMLDVESDGSPDELLAQAVLEVLYSAGLRVSELVGLDLGDLDLRRGRLVVHGKGDRDRIGLLGVPAVAAVERWLQDGRSERERPDSPAAVFLGAWGKRLGARSVRRIINGRASGPVHPHQIRHTAATHLLEGGMGLRDLQEYLGHEDLETTAHYAHVRPAMLRSTVLQNHPRSRSVESEQR